MQHTKLKEKIRIVKHLCEKSNDEHYKSCGGFQAVFLITRLPLELTTSAHNDWYVCMVNDIVGHTTHDRAS